MQASVHDGAASVKSSPRSRSRLERLKARGRWKPQSPTDPHGEDTCTNLWPDFTVPRPRHSLSPRLQRVAPPRLGQAMRRWCLTRFTKGKISLAWVSPRTRRVAQFDLTKMPPHVNFCTIKQLLGGWEASRNSKNCQVCSVTQVRESSLELVVKCFALLRARLLAYMPQRPHCLPACCRPDGKLPIAQYRAAHSSMHRSGVPACIASAYRPRAAVRINQASKKTR